MTDTTQWILCLLLTVFSTVLTSVSGAQALLFSQTQQISTGKELLTYHSVAESIIVKDQNNQAQLNFFSISYLAKDPHPKRPITFIFNGGPGSSSIWLHLGLFGPKRLQLPPQPSQAGLPPYALTDNPHTLLKHSDLVFIDPIGTGFSRAAQQGSEADYWSVESDARATERFISAYLNKHNRFHSPKFIIGESYGSIRASLVASYLQHEFKGILLNGLLLIAPAMDVSTFIYSDNNDLAYILALPTYAATALYHKKTQLPKGLSIDQYLAQVEAFAINHYSVALLKRADFDLESPQGKQLLEQLAAYTGLSQDYLRGQNLRVSGTEFSQQLLTAPDQRQVTGFLDSRYKGLHVNSDLTFNDPSIYSNFGVFISAFNHYLRNDLKINLDRDYVAVNAKTNSLWQGLKPDSPLFSGYLNVLGPLSEAMTKNKALKVYVASGVYDLTIPYYSADYMLKDTRLDSQRINYKRYFAGHMMYYDDSAFLKMSQDINQFIIDALK